MKEGNQRIALHLDKAFATSEWIEFFRNPKVHHLAESTSDHCILAIFDSSPQVHKRKCKFHFEAMWAKEMIVEKSLIRLGTWALSPPPLRISP